MSSDRNCVLIDLSGTIHIDDDEIPGSIKALLRLRKSGFHVKFVSNTTKESQRSLVERLNKIGFCISKDEVFTSLSAAHSIIKERQLRPLLLIDDRAREDFNDIPTDNPNSVVVGLAPDAFNYESLNMAFRILLSGDNPLIAIHKGRYYKTNDCLSLGPGPFVTALEYSSGTSAEVIGKPEKQFFLSAIKDFGLESKNCIMIGDDVRDDIIGAQNAGMVGILVKTGKYRPGDEISNTVAPNHVADNFSQAVDLVLQLSDHN